MKQTEEGGSVTIRIKNGHVTLDGKIIRGIRECEFSIKEKNDSFAELSLKMDVLTLGDKFTAQFDSTLNKPGKVGNAIEISCGRISFPNGRLGCVSIN